MKSIRNSKGLYWGLIITFFILYFLVGFVSTLHSITFFELANAMWMAVMLGITYEVGQAAVLFSILMSDNNKKLLPWLLMILLTALQVTANVYASFKFMDGSGSNDWTYWQRSILFWLEADGPEMFKVVISWITGALLPVVALGMTALVAENLKLKDEQDKAKEENEDGPKEPDNSFTAKEYIEKQNASPDMPEHYKQFAEELLKNTYKKDPAEGKAKIDPESGFEVVHEPFEVDLPPRHLGVHEEGDSSWANEEIVNPPETKKKEEIPVDEIPEEKLSTNPRGKKVTKKPSNASRGWHLKKEHIDDNGDVYRYGRYIPGEHAELPPEEQSDSPKKA